MSDESVMSDREIVMQRYEIVIRRFCRLSAVTKYKALLFRVLQKQIADGFAAELDVDVSFCFEQVQNGSHVCVLQ